MEIIYNSNELIVSFNPLVTMAGMICVAMWAIARMVTAYFKGE